MPMADFPTIGKKCETAALTMRERRGIQYKKRKNSCALRRKGKTFSTASKQFHRKGDEEKYENHYNGRRDSFHKQSMKDIPLPEMSLRVTPSSPQK